MSDIKKDDEGQRKIKAADHDIYGSTTIMALLVPLIGIVLGVIHLSKSTEVDHKLGEHLIAVGIISGIMSSIIWYTFLHLYLYV